MGRLDQEPFNQQVINDRMKATRAVDDSAPDGYLTGRKKGTKPNQAVNFNRLGELALSKRAARKEQGTKEEFRQQLNAHKPYTAKEMYWKAPTHFRVFDPTEYARERKVSDAFLMSALLYVVSFEVEVVFCVKTCSCVVLEASRFRTSGGYQITL
jgi:hypothetical protein